MQVALQPGKACCESVLHAAPSSSCVSSHLLLARSRPQDTTRDPSTVDDFHDAFLTAVGRDLDQVASQVVVGVQRYIMTQLR